MENTNNTLARSLKIASIIMQRKFFEKIFSEKSLFPSPDGDPSFRYTGYIFPENRNWLVANDFDVFTTRCSDSNAEKYGFETHIITPSDNITLCEEEMVESTTMFENLIASAKEHVENNTEGFMAFLKSLGVNIDDEEEDDENDTPVHPPYSI